ncbi:MAG: hypothetical protein Ta2E_00190 [Mycoplasmoidaceae bacterium]|nr:MAG: hypothetical protein Ta2E_00190 [Mycoplasmoidaceae bacterium]
MYIYQFGYFNQLNTILLPTIPMKTKPDSIASDFLDNIE